MSRSTKYQFLNGKCASFAIAANQLLGWPLFVAKIKTKCGIGTHIFVYSKGIGFDANGFYNPESISNILEYRKISKKTLAAINRLHLHLINKTDINKAKRYIKDKFGF